MLIFKELLRHLVGQGKNHFLLFPRAGVVERLCHRVIIIDRGKIVADAQVEKLKEITAQKSLEDVFQKLTEASEVGKNCAGLQRGGSQQAVIGKRAIWPRNQLPIRLRGESERC